MIFEIRKNFMSDWEWVLKTKNGKSIAISYNSYKRKSDCIKAAKKFTVVGCATIKVIDQ